MKTIYYYYYLFYSKIIKDDEPYATTSFTLSMSEGFFVNFILNILIIDFYCFALNKWAMISIQLLIIFINYFYFNKSKRAKEIVQEKPMFYFNHKLSIVLSSLFFIFTLSFMFWGPIYVKYLLDTKCR